MRIRPRPGRRSGATMAETGVVLLTFMIAVLGLIDLGVAVFRQNVISEAARRGSRTAAVHGYQSPVTGQWDMWGSSTVSGQADSTGTPIIDKMKPFLQDVVPLSQTTIKAEWPDGNNWVESRVRVTVTTTYQPMLTLIFNTSFTLKAESTTYIAH